MSREVHVELGELERLLSERTAIEKRHAEVLTEIEERRRVLERLIRGGATTGDRIRDFVLASSWMPFTQFHMERYRALDEVARKHGGELVLVEYWHPELIKHVMFPSPGNKNEYEWHRTLLVGQLSGGGLHLSVSSLGCELPVEKFLVYAGDTIRTVHTRIREEWSVGGTFFCLPHTDLPQGTDKHAVGTVFIGDSTVRRKLDEDGLGDMFITFAEKLDKLVLVPEE